MTDVAKARLAEAAALRGYPATEETIGAILRCLQAVLRRTEDVNLTSAETLEEAVSSLALSSFAVWTGWPAGREPRLAVDLGSGNGFPGVVVALAWPRCRVLLVERREKKARALAECAADAGVRNVEAVACDGRELLRHRPEARGAVDLVTARAVGTIEEVNRIAAPWLAPGGRILHWKGVTLGDDERADARHQARVLGLSPLPEIDFGPPPPGPARLVVYERSPA